MTPAPRFESLTDTELIDRLVETDATHDDAARVLLQDELRRRMHARAEQQHAQHAEITRIIAHLDEPSVDWAAVVEFFRQAFVELQDPWPDSQPM